ncbi:hypothetical protein F4802DRAFT_560995 [Xylaria palmicola]|nr:hypothetical protein F4802DRAFT_560995 [Xylaria palmicola]
MDFPDRDRERIQDWIRSVEVEIHEEPPLKRARCVTSLTDTDTDTSADTFIYPYNALPNTPPMSETPTRKRQVRDEMDDPNATPKASSKTTSNPIQLWSPSPHERPRSRPASPTKKTELQMLEKPIYVKALKNNVAHLPNDVKSLYASLLPVSFGEEIIPSEVSSEVKALVGSQARPYSFRTATTTPEAASIHTALLDVLTDAMEAADNGYYEHSWNNFVHTPLLKKVFASSQYAGFGGGGSIHQDPRARVVGVMSAPILGDYIPCVLPHPPVTEPATENDLVSLSQGVPALSVSEPYTNPLFGLDAPKLVQTRTNSKKVNYVLALDLGDTPLLKVLKFYLHNDAVMRYLSAPHINQTLYPTLSYSPIACSIETKVATATHDPLLQLGIWVAAWHKRMKCLREYLISEATILQPKNSERIPSTLLIEVVNHNWQLYFACDQGQSINVYGPLTIGSTENLVDAYMLYASLSIIKDWIQTTFYEGMQKWLMCDTLLQLVGVNWDKEQPTARGSNASNAG